MKVRTTPTTPHFVPSSSCGNPKFIIPKVCLRCREAEIWADWDICRRCALMIEIEQTDDPEARLKLVLELLGTLGGGDFLQSPLP
jgi:hypothetical protein